MKTGKKTSAKSSAPKHARKTAANTPKSAGSGQDATDEAATTMPVEPAAASSEEDEGDADIMEGELLEFVRAIDEYKRINRRQFPTWGEVLRVVRTLGYKRSA